jgi:hypothetical protein
LLSGRPHRVEELADFEFEAVGVAGKRLRGGEYLRGSRSGLAGATLHIGDVGRDLLRALRGLLDVARDFLRRCALLFDRCRNRRGYLRQFFDGAADLLDSTDRFLRRGLDPGDLLIDLAGRFRGLLGQRFHFGSNHRKAAAGLARACRLDSRIQSEQIGLPGDRIDEFDDVADAGCRLRQFTDAVVGLSRCHVRLVPTSDLPFCSLDLMFMGQLLCGTTGIALHC